MTGTILTWGGTSTSTTTERRYEVGTLIIAMFDQQEKKMIYTSTGSGTIKERQMAPEEAQAEVDAVVGRMLSVSRLVATEAGAPVSRGLVSERSDACGAP